MMFEFKLERRRPPTRSLHVRVTRGQCSVVLGFLSNIHYKSRRRNWQGYTEYHRDEQMSKNPQNVSRIIY